MCPALPFFREKMRRAADGLGKTGSEGGEALGDDVPDPIHCAQAEEVHQGAVAAEAGFRMAVSGMPGISDLFP